MGLCRMQGMMMMDEPGVPEGAVFENAALRRVVYVDETKALAIAKGPFKIVHQ